MLPYFSKVVQAYKKMGGAGNSVDIDLAIALDHLTLAAVEKGLGTVWIGAFDEDAVKRILDIPEDMKVVAIVPVGYPGEPGILRPAESNKRKSRDQVFGFDKF